MNQNERFLLAGAIMAGAIAFALSQKPTTPKPPAVFALTSFTAEPTVSGRLLSMWHNGTWNNYDLYLNNVLLERFSVIQPIVYDAQFTQLVQGRNEVYLVSFDSFGSTHGLETTPSAFFNI